MTNNLQQTYTQNYLFTFNIAQSLEMTSTQTGSQINLTAQDVFNLNSNVTSASTTTLNINSNAPWKLYITTGAFAETNGQYFVQVKSSTDNATVPKGINIKRNRSDIKNI